MGSVKAGGRTTARNYAAQAQRGLRDFAEKIRNHRGEVFASDAVATEAVASLLDKAVHFAIPDGGMLLDDHLKGIEDQPIRLPYPIVSIEYHVAESTITEHTPVHCPKHVVVAKETTKQETLEDVRVSMGALLSKDVLDSLLRQIGRIPSERIISVYAVCEIGGLWFPMPAGWLLPSDCWDDVERGYRIAPLIFDPKNPAPRFTGKPHPVLPLHFAECMRKYGAEYGLSSLMNDIGGEVRALLELCEALTCSNVGTEIIQTADAGKNARRTRDGKLPIFETRCLTIEVPGSTASRGGNGADYSGDRNSPRQHLRRGHIRALPDGRRIWVTSCVVGDPSKGFVNKSYRMKAA